MSCKHEDLSPAPRKAQLCDTYNPRTRGTETRGPTGLPGQLCLKKKKDKRKMYEAGEMPQPLRALAVLAEHMGLVPSPHTG